MRIPSIAGLEVEESKETKEEVKAEPSEFVMVTADDDCVQVKVPFKEPRQTDCCSCCQTDLDVDHEHVCNLCDVGIEELRSKTSLKAVRDVLKFEKPERFEFVLDKTICLWKGITKEKFDTFNSYVKEQLRKQLDPERRIREDNDAILKQIAKEREKLRLLYFERVTDLMLEQASEPSQPSRLAELPERPSGSAAGPATHRTLERLEVTNLDIEIREKRQELELAEDDHETALIQVKIAELEEQKNKLKDQIRLNEAAVRANPIQKLTKENMFDQTWHDSRYHQAVRQGVSHSSAWAQEKKRRKATLRRKEGVGRRRAELKEADLQWHAEFDEKKVKEEEFHTEILEGVESGWSGAHLQGQCKAGKEEGLEERPAEQVLQVSQDFLPT